MEIKHDTCDTTLYFKYQITYYLVRFSNFIYVYLKLIFIFLNKIFLLYIYLLKNDTGFDLFIVRWRLQKKNYLLQWKTISEILRTITELTA